MAASDRPSSSHRRARPADITRSALDPVLGKHPEPPEFFGEVYTSRDQMTISKVSHRALAEKPGMRPKAIKGIRDMLRTHHVSPEVLAQQKKLRNAVARLGFRAQQIQLKWFPTAEKTRKANLAEIVLAEYLVATSALSLPVYRLRNNPNVNQPMKGDDVLAFDLDADPVRVVVGEAKFRTVSSPAVVKEIVATLLKSHRGGIPVSLQFVAEQLFASKQVELGERVLNCVRLFALGNVRFDYVGFLLSDPSAAARVNQATPKALRRLAMVSLGVSDPNSLVSACYKGLN